MFARVSKYEIPVEGIDSAVQGFEQVALEDWDGFHRAYLLVDRASGKALSITMWESEEALHSSAERANQAREQVMDAASGSIVTVKEYEVASVTEGSPARA